MRTITFYSFKGGTGRSLALAQLAVILARFGRSVCVLDFDIEAPGLQHKFSSLQHHPLPNVELGIVDYIRESQRSRAVPVLDNKVMRLTSPADGAIHIFPCGDIHGDYFDTVASPEWYRFLFSLEGHTRSFFLELRDRIERELDPAPEYLLIDSRSGITELAGICTRLLADEVVLLTTDTPDALDGTNLVLRSFEYAREARADAPSKVHMVLSRTPYYFFDEAGDFHWIDERESKETANRILNTLNYRLTQRVEELYNFALEPRVQLSEHLLIRFSGKAESSPLARDYVEFFGKLLGMEEELQDLLGEVRVFRPYLLVRETGKIINPEDNAWNVAFRVDTLTQTFSSLYESILSNARRNRTESEAREAAWTALYDAGLQAAESFSLYLREHWSAEEKKRGQKIQYREILDDWCKFDSTVGFGRFENEPDGEGSEGRIILVDNFLLFGRPSHDVDLCAFMVGYITRVLSAIFEVGLDDTKVIHDLERHCNQQRLQGTDELSVCYFPYSVRAVKAPKKKR